MYLILDNYGDYKEIMTYKQMYEMLIDEIIRDSKENYNEYEIISQNLEQLRKLALNNLVNETYIIENLQSYGFYIININDLKTNLNELREYTARKSPNLEVFDNMIKFIEEELK